jgi:acyl-phosphate glycerol 3-phosphate acyltransferase
LADAAGRGIMRLRDRDPGETMDWLVILLMPLVGYLIGSIPFGYLVARSRGVDIFRHGSGNIGATNVGRVLGRRLGVLVFVLDFAKGVVPVVAALAVCAEWHRVSLCRNGWLEVLTGLAAFLGHLFPLFLGLRGGKGVATGTGVAFVLVPGPALAALAAWAVVVIVTRYVSLASLVAVFVLVLAQLAAGGDWTGPRTVFCLLAGAMVLVKHRANIARLLQGNENQLRENPAMTRLSKSLHVLAVGLWFGAAVFFTFVVGFSLFGSFERVGANVRRPAWFPISEVFDRADDTIDGRREQGSRAAGFAIAPMFDWYFFLQGACGLIAVLTALPWVRRGGVHRWRASLLITALALVVVGWPLEQYVAELRGPRNDATEAYLRAAEPTESQRQAMQSARAAFGMWHGVSVMLNLAMLVCLTAATALAAHLPAEPVASPASKQEAAPPVPEPVAGS